MEFPHTLSSIPLEIPFPLLVKEKYLTLQKISTRIAICKYSNLDKANKPQPIKFISGLNLKLQEAACRVFQIAVRRGERGYEKFCWWGGGGFVYWVLMMIWTFSKAKQHSVNTEHQLKKINLNIFIQWRGEGGWLLVERE